ncbi:hypothetical protein WHR41_06513 [Cladosporium halotolerans]|uniref:Uncharacterized protein n=1 Tax=Cladosporium halotolerans TaxID=1052096 RepID=A0AB34KJF6_9PEZI
MDDMQMTASDGDDGPDSLGAPSSQVPDSLASGRVACEACRTRKVCLSLFCGAANCPQPPCKSCETFALLEIIFIGSNHH